MLIGGTFQARIGIWKCWFLRRGENWSTNQQPTQPTWHQVQEWNPGHTGGRQVLFETLEEAKCIRGLHVGTMMFMNLNRIHAVIGIHGNDVSNNHINLYLDWFRIQAFGEEKGFQQVGTQYTPRPVDLE